MSPTSGATWHHGAGRQAPRECAPARGEVWWCEMAEIGRRPEVVPSRDAAIPRLRRALVAPCTTTIRGLASDVVLEPGSDPIPRRSVVNLDSVESVSVAVLVSRLGRLADTRMRAICAALEVAVDCSGSVSRRWAPPPPAAVPPTDALAGSPTAHGNDDASRAST
jgi:mRNA interferase MazF